MGRKKKVLPAVQDSPFLGKTMATQPPPGSVIGDRIAELENSIRKLQSSNEYMLACPEFKEDKDLQVFEPIVR